MNTDILKNEIVFMPDATRGAVRSLTTKQLEETGTKALVTNTLHLLMYPGPERIETLGGIKNMMGWKGLVLTDSGGFQVFSLIHSKKWNGKVTDNGAIFKSPREGKIYELTPESSIDIQIKIGSDVLVTLDDCREANISRRDAEISVNRTIKWAERAKKHFEDIYGGKKKTGKLLTCVVQGSEYLDLREYCAKELVKIGFDGYNFGGYVINNKGELVKDEMDVVARNTPNDCIKYAMGVGKPEDIFESVKLGYNLFDTVLVTRNARHGSLYTSEGELRIVNSKYSEDKTPIDKYCSCEACKSYSKAYIHHMLKNSEITGLTLATIHNLTFYQSFIKTLNSFKDDLKDMTYISVLEEMHK